MNRWIESSFIKVQCCEDCGWVPRYNRFLGSDCCPICGSEKIGQAIGKYRILVRRALFIFHDEDPKCFIYKNGNEYRFDEQILVTHP
jgi:hypothetical protein